ncbi:porin family protein [Sphingomonas parva]|uniref:Porin family protein n=1 Tax=Sphingomonas parva TaxID=2555898 RepID=A0A4Y8ZNU4_9SPHN|nr:outer membrane beta-barrel protein [Sphingomonas parva]TFI56815.1 porin family protein [Sphingomonas parva]
MKKIIPVAVAAATLFAAPAFAQSANFAGPRVGATVGFADDDFLGTETFTYGANVGYDFDLGNAVVGVTGEYQDSDDTGRDLSIVARAGAPVGSKALVYGLAGYTNLGSGTGFSLDGARVGAGVEVAVTPNVFLNLEQRYSNYEAGVDGFQTVAGLGFRF